MPITNKQGLPPFPMSGEEEAMNQVTEPANPIPGIEAGAQETPVDEETSNSYKSELLALLEAVKEKKAGVDSRVEISRQKVAENKSKLLPLIFEAMQSEGVDLTNLFSIRQYLEQLEEVNPDLFELFVEALNSLMPSNDIFNDEGLEGQEPAPEMAPEMPGMPGVPGMPEMPGMPVAQPEMGGTPAPENPVASRFSNLANMDLRK